MVHASPTLQPKNAAIRHKMQTDNVVRVDNQDRRVRKEDIQQVDLCFLSLSFTTHTAENDMLSFLYPLFISRPS